MSEVQNYILAEQDYMSGMKYKDIAEKYGVTINTVKSWKMRYGWNKKVCTQNIKKCAHKKRVEDEKEKAIVEAINQVIENPDLTDKQRLFCVIYARCFNATKAYKKAYGCCYDVANSEGYKLLVNPCIREEIKRLKQNRLNREMLDESDIFQKYMDIAFSDVTDFIEFGQEEVPVMSMYGPVEIKDEETGEKKILKKRVNIVRFKNSAEVDGTLISEVKQGKDGASIKLADRMKALEWLSSHMDLATNEQKAHIEQMRAKTEQIRSGTAMDDDEGVEIINDAPKETGENIGHHHTEVSADI